jgi:hypothetical protein
VGFFCLYKFLLEAQTMNDPIYLTEQQVSKMTHRAVNTLRADRHYRRGIPYYKIGRKVLYRKDTVIVHIEGRKIETTDSEG